MESGKPFNPFPDPHKKAQHAIDHAREVREEKLAELGKRKLRIVGENPLLGVCEYCNAPFSAGLSPLAKSDIQQQFNAHKCKPLVKVRQRITLLIILCLALTTGPAWAQNWSYDNGPINGTTDAWTISFGYIVSDTFVAAGANVTAFQFGVWKFPGDTLTSVQWSITSGENSGTLYGSGTASGAGLSDTFISTNQYGYDIDTISVSGLSVSTTSGTKYWLNLFNAHAGSGDPVFWDENSGAGCQSQGCPSKASESAVGTIPSEAFTISGGTETTPEPNSILLFASGIVGLAGALHRRLWKSN